MRTLLRSLLAAGVLGLMLAGSGRAQQPEPENPEPRLVVQLSHLGPVHSAVFSPDGKFLLTGGNDETARLWDRATGRLLLVFAGHEAIGNSTGVNSVAYAPDGRRILTGGADHTARLWDARTGKELATIRHHRKPVTSVAFAPDGQRILTGSWDHTARLSDATTGKEVRLFKGHTDRINAVAFAPDGKRILTGSTDQTGRLWDAQTGKELRTFKGYPGAVMAVAYAPDGQRVATAGTDGTARVWDASTGKELLAVKASPGELRAVAFAPDGKRFLTGALDQKLRFWDATTGQALAVIASPMSVNSAVYSADGKFVLTGERKNARLWEVETGQLALELRGHSGALAAVAFSPDGQRILTGSGGLTARLWDARAGQAIATLTGHSRAVTRVAFVPDGGRVLTGSPDQTVHLWDTVTGKSLRTLSLTDRAGRVAFDTKGQRVLAAGEDNTARLYDVTTGKQLLVLAGHTDRVTAMAISTDGQRLVTGSGDLTARLWDGQTGKELNKFVGHDHPITTVAFSPDGQRLATGGHLGVRVWDAQIGKELFFLKGHTKPIHALAFSPDGRRLLSASLDHTARLWDVATGKQVFVLRGHTARVSSIAFSPEGQRILTASWDGTARLWDAATGEELCRLVSFHDRSWAVVDSAGRFDASQGGDVEDLHYVVRREPIALSQLKERYYDPGLLAKYLGFNKEPLRDVAAFRDVKLYPRVAVDPTDDTAKFSVQLTNRGGGIGRIVVLVNGKEQTGDARPRGAVDANAAQLELTLDLSNDPRVMPGKKNRVEVLAYNAEGYLCSRGMVREFDGPGKPDAVPPHLYAVIAGIASYRGEKLKLRYAAKDAEDFSTALKLAAEGLFGHDHVHVTVLTAEAGETRPGRDNLVKALESLKSTRAGDVVVVYLAGHGVTQGGQDGDWYYLSADAASADLSDPAVRKQIALSSAQLTDLLKAVPAQKQGLILDTCHSGRFIAKLTNQRDIPGSQVRALERVKDRTGMHVLAGCAADAVSYEASCYGQGLLTYSLLQGMRGAKLREGEYVDVAALFGYAADRVPELARGIGGIQRPTIASPSGAGFDIGRLTAADRARVPLQATRPTLVRSVFQLEKPPLDSLGLSQLVDGRLLEASTAARDAKVGFVDAAEYVDGILPSGRYTIDDKKVTLHVSLFKAGKELAAFTVEGEVDRKDALAEKIAAEIEKKLASSAGR